ncbi:MAG TPA: carbohydrate ABC transporter permease [Firmicutes bacterium]|jgi:ABC-type glycerol-3-phosphate transport system permease component|nr:MAG: hypothetical protein AA931_12630 [Peptococcaceae bacterium 1109]HHT72413.1 carbohydrate ABC transporter permease [Bacillota bacterium]
MNWKRLGLVLTYVVITFVMVSPIAMTIITSFKTQSEIYIFPPTIIPQNPTLDAYKHVLFSSSILKQFYNSMKVSAVTILLTVTLGSLTGFAFARASFPGKSFLLFFLLGTQMIPGLGNAIALYYMAFKLGMLNTHLVLVLVYSAASLPVSVWLMKSYFEQIPPELEQAAQVDGCTPFQALTRVVLPLARPGMVASALMVFVAAWNEFLIALLMITRTALKTFPVGLYTFIGQFQMDWPRISAAATIGVVPLILLFLLLQRHFVAGLTAGAVKA